LVVVTSVATTVTFVPTTAAVVVAVVADAITNPVVVLTQRSTNLLLGVQTQAVITINVAVLRPTAVATIPVTPTVVVAVVAGVISLPIQFVTHTA